MLIPEDRQQDVLDVFWVLLREAEVRASKHPIARRDVEAGYRLMRDLGVTTAYPQWEGKEKQ